MPDRPLLIFPSPTRARRESLTSAQPRLHVPSAARQAQRIGPKFEVLRKALEDEAISMRTTAAGVEPEQVIVLEIVGSVEDFANAVRRVEGLEWLAEWDQDEIAPDEDFFSRGRDGEEDHEKVLRGRVFLVISNKRGMDQLLSLWDRYQTDPDQQFDRGLNRFREVFRHLRELRRWDERDRIHETGMLEYWRDALEHGYDPIRFEVEFWYRSDEGRRRAVFEAFREVVGEVGGTCLNECIIDEVAYHAAIAQLPPAGVQDILDRVNTRVVRSNNVMFFRPLGQCAVEPPDDLGNLGDPVARPDPPGLREPVAALLDGLPLENPRCSPGG